MTIVAAHRPVGIPVLIGDFLISRGDKRFRGRKKISRVRDNLAVGWAGTFVAATAVLHQMRQELSERPTIVEVDQWLSACDPTLSNGQQLKLVGWVVDDEPTGFHWDGGSPSVVTEGDEWFIGSGSSGYELAARRYMTPPDPGSTPDEREALERIVPVLASANCDDMITRSGYDIGVGGGYEALYWAPAQDRFLYVEDISYFVVIADMDARGRLRAPFRIADPLRRYWTVEDCSFLAVAEGGRDDPAEIWAMTSAGDTDTNGALAVLANLDEGPIQMKSSYYGGVIVFRTPHVGQLTAPFVGCPWDTGQTRIKGGIGRLEVSLAREELEHGFAEMVRYGVRR
ncbi:MAG TPA: hypothetical protein VEW67_00125 [Thermoleophilaceae bacterium]|nr:hypothetical protein [Thermoleophilaceae bacterium]